ncbi:MAG: SIS domain-containing protein [Myxococcales bacterium]|nr:SIS domain-containing protein [Myxococcales bacterium]MBK7198127.1 SIS domain-containing protein [Myxococcales bacterium]
MTADVARAALVDGVRVRQELIATELPAIVAAGELIAATLAAGGKVLLCGNGGSAADAQHIAAELVGRFVVERRGLPAIALTTDTSALTAIGNDYGYELVFRRQVEALGRPGDVLIAITTSGTSKNVVAAADAARALGVKVIGLTGARGRAFVDACDAGVVVPSGDTARIQECHIAIGHVWCAQVDAGYGAAHPAPVAAAPKLYDLDGVVAFRERCRAHKRTVAWTNGVFDVLHVGHLQSLRAARGFADVLIVGVNSDASVRGNKGPSRPIFPAIERCELLAALECVDAITVFDAPTPVEVLTAVRPDVHVKGADYAPPHGKPIPEAALVASWGGKVEFVPLVPGRSSTDTLARLLAE